MLIKQSQIENRKSTIDTMNTSLRLLPALFLTLALAACGSESADAPSSESGEAQTVEVTAGPNGYVPERVTLQAGQPARLVFTRTVDSECSSQVKIPALGVGTTDLPMNEPVAITVTPQEAGTFEFICGMDMQTGTIAVEAS